MTVKLPKVIVTFGIVGVSLLGLELVSGMGIGEAFRMALFGALGAAIGSAGLEAYRREHRK
jgi:hypothetical protein